MSVEFRARSWFFRGIGAPVYANEMEAAANLEDAARAVLAEIEGDGILLEWPELAAAVAALRAAMPEGPDASPAGPAGDPGPDGVREPD